MSEREEFKQPIHKATCTANNLGPCNCGLEWKVPTVKRALTEGDQLKTIREKFGKLLLYTSHPRSVVGFPEPVLIISEKSFSELARAIREIAEGK